MTVPLSWYQRILLWSRLGVASAANLQEASVYLRLIDKTRPTDEEKQACGFEVAANGFNWLLPVEEFGNLRLDLEDDERKALVACLEATNPAAPIPMTDAKWMLGFVKTLKEKPE